MQALSHVGAGLSGCHIEEVDFNDVEVVYSKDAPGNVETEVSKGNEGVQANVELYPGDGMLLKNPKPSMMNEDIKLWRYLYRIPLSVEIQVPTTHERVVWVVPSRLAIY